jgi:subfamily B ATP-binding cassette protein MsbA
MTYFRKILQYAVPYKKFAVLNIICNVFYALFSTLSFIALIPVINILFDKSQRVEVQPVWEGFSGIKDYLVDYFNYNVSQRVAEDEVSALSFGTEY